MNEQQNENQFYNEESYDEQAARERRAMRIQEMKKEKARCIFFQNCIKIAVPAFAVILVISIIIINVGKNSEVEAASASHPDTSKLTAASLEQDVVDGAKEGEAERSNTNVKNDTNLQDNEIAQNHAILQDNEIVQNHTTLQDNTIAQNHEISTNDSVLTNDTTTHNTVNSNITPNETVTAQTTHTIYSANTTEDTLALGSEIVSTNALLIDLESDSILAEKAAHTVISPASMTKVLTVLVAAEQIQKEQLDDTFTMTLDITDYAYVNDCSSVGFLNEEIITVRDLFYGTILPSGGDAAVGLAVYVAGSHEAFVELMNDKLEALGLSDTAHVTNCVGLYDKEHHCTVYDMAMIMEAAIENDICREVLNAHTYTTTSTEQHPEGITISNWFLRRIEDKDTGGEVLCGKTGYVVQSGNCAVSFGMDHGGKGYVCVTANATSNWKCIYDHVKLYKMFATGEKPVP